MINIPVWMFLLSYEKLRNNLLLENTIINMIYPGRGIFGSDFGTTVFVISKRYIKYYLASYRRLFDIQGEVKSNEEREKAFLSQKGEYFSNQYNFSKIPGTPIAYWLSNSVISIFDTQKKLSEEYGIGKKGLSTGNNDIFLRLWYEVNFEKCGFELETYKLPHKWIPLNKGGSFRKWYGNNEYVIDWYDNGNSIKSYSGSVIRNPEYYFKESITWTMLSASCFGVRFSNVGKIFEGAGPSLFVNKNNLHYILALLCSKLGDYFIRILNPTININIGDVCNIPVIISRKTEIELLSQDCINLSKSDWDSFETSWDFEKHPLMTHSISAVWDSEEDDPNVTRWLLENDFNFYKACANDKFSKLKVNEEELNRIFIDIYGLQEELTPDVADKDVTVHYICDTKDDIPETLKDSKYVLTKQDVIKSFISYAVGCMFGRYSLDTPGLAFAGGEWNSDNYKSFIPYKNNIIPICDDEYFSNDITNRFVEFIKTVYGEATLDENLKFIADALGGKGSPKEVINNYFLSVFYADHLKTYQKRPIYWL